MTTDQDESHIRWLRDRVEVTERRLKFIRPYLVGHEMARVANPDFWQLHDEHTRQRHQLAEALKIPKGPDVSLDLRVAATFDDPEQIKSMILNCTASANAIAYNSSAYERYMRAVANVYLDRLIEIRSAKC